MIRRLTLIICLAFVVSLLASCQDQADSTTTIDDSTKAAPVEQVDQPADQPATPAAQTGQAKLLPRPILYEGDDPEFVQQGAKAAMRKAIEFLRQTQNADGGWPPPNAAESNLGLTSVAVTGLATTGLPADDPMMAKALAYILGFVRDDGGIHDGTSMNYTTSLCVTALTTVDAVKYEAIIRRAGENIGRNQWSSDPESADFGGAGYGGQHNRPDMSNTNIAIQARKIIEEANIDVDDEFMQRALVFVSRNQGGEASKGYWVSAADGGFIYSTHNGGESKAGEFIMAGGGRGLKAYGSMTYAGFLSLIYAGLDRDDQRVQAALEWIGKNWTLEENPEMGLQGYYYYLMLMGKALHAYGEPVVVDDKGTNHQWRQALTARMIELQGEDGSWINQADRWFEGAKPVVTGYGLIAMSFAMKELPTDQ